MMVETFAFFFCQMKMFSVHGYLWFDGCYLIFTLVKSITFFSRLNRFTIRIRMIVGGGHQHKCFHFNLTSWNQVNWVTLDICKKWKKPYMVFDAKNARWKIPLNKHTSTWKWLKNGKTKKKELSEKENHETVPVRLVFCLRSGKWTYMSFLSFKLPWRRLIRFFSVWLAQFCYKHYNNHNNQNVQNVTYKLQGLFHYDFLCKSSAVYSIHTCILQILFFFA